MLTENHNLKFVWMASLVAAMGGLLFGYDWVVIGGAKPFYEVFFGLDSDSMAWQAGWAMSSALAGCLFGALLSGALTDHFGRKKILIGAAFLFTWSALWTALAHEYNSFIAARIIGGVGIGLASNVSPIYIAEISPAEMRGRFVSINQLTIVIGVLAAQIINLAISRIHPLPDQTSTHLIFESWNGQIGWRWMFAAEAFPAGLFFLLALKIPESPRWLLKNSFTDKARMILQKIGGAEYAEAEISDVEASLIGEHNTSHYAELLRGGMLKIIGLGIFIAVFQQWCGINVIFNYAQEILEAAGYDINAMMFGIVITGIVNLIFTFVAIKTVDRWGRRPLMLLGSGGLMLIYTLLGGCYHFDIKGVAVIVVLLMAIAVYAMTLAPITWVLISEIFPNRIRGAAVSIAVSSLWIACFLLTLSFKPINAALGAAGTFWLYGIICLIGFIILWRKVPETKGKSLEDIERELLR